MGQVRYKPWGENRYTSGTTPTTNRFTGQRQEASVGGGSGLYFYNARWYDPAIGRFLSADTVVAEPGNPQALNRYSYVYNSPIKYTDPSGHCVGSEIDGQDPECWEYYNTVILPLGIVLDPTDELWTLANMSLFYAALEVFRDNFGADVFQSMLDLNFEVVFGADRVWDEGSRTLSLQAPKGDLGFLSDAVHELAHVMFTALGLAGDTIVDDFGDRTGWRLENGKWVNPRTGPTVYARGGLINPATGEYIEWDPEEDLAESLAITVVYGAWGDLDGDIPVNMHRLTFLYKLSNQLSTGGNRGAGKWHWR